MSKHITTADYNKFTKDIVVNSVKSKNSIDKSAITRFISNAELDRKLATLATTAKLKAEQDKIATLQAFYLSYFRGKNHFEGDGTQICLVFQSMYKYFKKINNTDIFQNGNCQNGDCLMKLLNLLICLIIALLQH